MYAEEESIYNLIPRPQEVPLRPPMHRSKFPGSTLPRDFEFGQNKHQGHATFGRPNGTHASNPFDPLRSHSKEPILPDPAPPTQTKFKVKAPVPAKDERPIMGLTSNKNFITSNAVDVILSKAKKPEDEFVWTMKPDYGKVPIYLKRNKALVATEKEQFGQYLRMREQPEAQARVSQLSQEDRAQLLKHLKLKWASLNQAYQGLSLSIDSAVKKHRKEDFERQLAETERDIKALERGETVLVVDD